MNNITDQSFVDATVDLDGNLFVRCTFERCNLRFNGTANFMATDCTTEGCEFSLGEPAGLVARQFRAMVGVGGLMGDTIKHWLFDPTAETIPPRH